MATEKPDHSQPGKLYNLTEGQKSAEMNVSPSWLAKDRMKSTPDIDFKRYGRSIRYASERQGASA